MLDGKEKEINRKKTGANIAKEVFNDKSGRSTLIGFIEGSEVERDTVNKD